MSAATGLAKQADGLEKLLSLANLNAKDIAAAGDETRKQMQLTQAEEARVSEARAYITKHESLAENLQQRENELAINKIAHEKAVSDFSKHLASENTRLENFSASLDARQKALTDSEIRHGEELKGLATVKAEYERQHQADIASVKTAENINIEIGKKLVAEEARLKEWEATLKGKAERIRQQVANF